jgi:hypothetical protein
MKDTKAIAGISPLTPSAKDMLRDEIAKLVQSDNRAVETFVDQVDQALVERCVVKKMVDLGSAKIDEVPKLATNANLAANALERLDGSTAQVILQAARMSVDTDIEAEIASLRSIAKAAQKYYDSVVRRPGGNALPNEDVSLLSEIATAYAAAFNTRPTYSEGPFSKSVRAIFQTARLGRSPEKSALKTALNGLNFEKFPPLKRGRRAKLK